MIFSAYRRDDFADPDGFAVQLGAVLEQYPDDVIRFVTSPRTGIQRKAKFPPTIAEIVEMCDAEVARIARIKKFNDMGSVRRLPRPHLPYANVFVPPDAPQYQAMVEKSKAFEPGQWWFRDDERIGIWVPMSWLTESTGKNQPRTFTKADVEATFREHEGAQS